MRSISLESIEGEDILWEEHSTYFQSMNPQMGPVWFSLRKCSLTASNASKWSGRSSFSSIRDPESFCGLLEHEETSPAAMVGILGEPIIRDWYKDTIHSPVREVGVSVWKENPIFRGSIDGDCDGDLFIEIKIPQYIYKPLITHLGAIKRGFSPPSDKYEHVFNSHYDQMTTNGIIHDKKYCDYIVASAQTGSVYIERIPIDQDHWKNILLPRGLEYYEQHMLPLMDREKLFRIDP